jgi:beta-barrel assembly-enhancing protease
MSARILLCCAFALLLGACASSPRSVTPLTKPGNGFLSSDSEKKLIGQADAAHQELLQRGLLLNDAEASAYLDRIGKRLQPAIPQGPAIRYFILKDPAINAMAFPNGNIYLHVGLLAKLESEDQLALVLAHETAHVVQRHSYKGKLDRHNSVVAAHVADLLLAGTGIAYLPFALDIASFSREQEKEADLCGLEYMAGQGYDLEHSLQVFDKLVEVKHAKGGSSVWASHPDLNARKNYSQHKIAELATTPASKTHKPEDYAALRGRLAVLAIQLRLLNRQYELALDAIDVEIARQGDAPAWRVYRGDTLREAAEHSDAAAQEHAWLHDKKLDDALKRDFQQKAPERLQAALDEYQAALKQNAQMPTAWRGIGLVAHQQGDRARAQEYLQRYLAQTPQPSDRRYIENLLSRLNQ